MSNGKDPEHQLPRTHSRPDIRVPPEGATCGKHKEAFALATCPVCGVYACIACWHESIQCCHTCLHEKRTNAGKVSPAWEHSISLKSWATTLANAWSGPKHIPMLMGSTLKRSAWFWMGSFVPMALASGIIPFTRLIYFGPAFQTKVVTSTSMEDALFFDVTLAMGVGLAFEFLRALALAIPYVTLCKAYMDREHHHIPKAALVLMLHRTWLLPFGSLLRGLIVWGGGSEGGGNDLMTEVLGSLALVFPIVLLIGQMRASARMLQAVKPLMAFVVILVPLLIYFLSESSLMVLFEQLTHALPNEADAKFGMKP